MNYQECVQDIKKDLSGLYPDDEISSIIAIIFEHFEGLDRPRLHMKFQEPVADDTVCKIKEAVLALAKQIPVQYIIGQTEFYDLTFKVSPGVLIPRPETEELAKWVIDDLQSSIKLRVLDIGTGSGCLAIVLNKNLDCIKSVGIDISKEAIKIARANNQLNKTNVSFKNMDILENQYAVQKKKWDVIVSNPPYVMEKEKSQMQPNVLDNEPGLALFVEDKDPLVFYKAIAEFAKRNLNKNGSVYVEINEALGTDTLNVFVGMGFSEVTLKNDLFNKERMIKAVL